MDAGDDLDALPDGPLDCRRRSEDVAHILFTSGSTGAPKGVMITHENVLAFLDWAIPYFGHTPADRISSHPPLHFDLSTFDIFGTLSTGASLYLIPPALSLLPHKLAEAIRTMELTQWFSVPSLLNYMARFDVVRPHDFPSLKRLLWCGEPFPTPALIYWFDRLPHATFTNLYGPTEATIASSYYRVAERPADEKAAIPVGTPCGGEELLVLDEGLRPLGPGAIGDLYIRGAGLSPGYWNDPEKTAAAFLRDPFSADSNARIYKTGDLASRDEAGLVYLHGRADAQIKSRGYRIELGEIETVLNTFEDTPGVRRHGDPERWFRRPGDLLRLRPRGRPRGIAASAAAPARRGPAGLHDSFALDGNGASPIERKRKDRPAQDQGTIRGGSGSPRPRRGGGIMNCAGRLTKIFAEKLLVEVESPETDLLDAGILDSMSFVELLLNLELEFGFRVEMESLDMENFRSIARIAELVESTRQGAEVARQSA